MYSRASPTSGEPLDPAAPDRGPPAAERYQPAQPAFRPIPQHYSTSGSWGGPPPSGPPQQFAGPAPWSLSTRPHHWRKRNPWAIVAGAAAARVRPRPRRHRHLRWPSGATTTRHPNADRHHHRASPTTTTTTTPTSTSLVDHRRPRRPKPPAGPAACRLPARHLQARGTTDAGRIGLREVRSKHRSQWPDNVGLRAVLGSQRRCRTPSPASQEATRSFRAQAERHRRARGGIPKTRTPSSVNSRAGPTKATSRR